MVSLFEYESLERKIKEGQASPAEKRLFQSIQSKLAREAPPDVPFKKFIRERLKRLEG